MGNDHDDITGNDTYTSGADPAVGGGGVLFGGPPNFIKRGKMARVCA